MMLVHQSNTVKTHQGGADHQVSGDMLGIHKEVVKFADIYRPSEHLVLQQLSALLAWDEVTPGDSGATPEQEPGQQPEGLNHEVLGGVPHHGEGDHLPALNLIPHRLQLH